MRRPKKRRVRKWLLFAALCVAVAAVAGCRTLGYYAQAIHGQFEIVSRRQPIDALIGDPQTPARLRERLERVQELRGFARTELKLPADKQFRAYADVRRPYVIWNVQAAAQFSLQPKSWWYPFLGSLEYRGYFSEEAARDYARRLWERGYDVYVDGVDAYSTLGWFADPVLNTFVYRRDPELAELLFHELGHQRVFVHGDTDFNEAFATTVGQEGARRWLRARGNTNDYEGYLVSLQRTGQFVQLILNARSKLERIFGDTRDRDGKIRAAKAPPASPDRLQREKERIFEELRRDYAQLRAGWDGFAGFDGWLAHDLNNAQLNSIANYYDFVPGFEQLLRGEGGDLEKFYRAVERLGKLSKEERHRRLRELAKGVPEFTPVSGPPGGSSALRPGRPGRGRL